MRQRKYTLPRHTNLARQGARIGAFLIDVAVLGAFTLALLFGVFKWIFNPMAEPYQRELKTEQINSHLRHLDENGDAVIIKTDSSFLEYRDVISYYYMNYLTGDVAEPGTGSRLANEKIKNPDGTEVSKKDYYTVAWFNREVLQIRSSDPDNDSNCYFTYEKVDGVYDTTKLGIAKPSSVVPESDVNIFMQKAYNDAYINSFNSLSYIITLTNRSALIYSAEFVLSAFLGGVITYVVFPLILKKGRTVGKIANGLALANSDGYAFEDKMLAMRIMPFVVVLASFLIPFWNDVFLVILIPLIVFLVSFALAMASPKKASLHDFCARTIVIDNKTSIIFDSELEEEAYIAKEDNLPTEEELIDENGEEPEISYEK